MSKEETKINIASLMKMLGELGDLAEHATLTGAMSSGKDRAVARYNAVLQQLVENKVVPQGMFSTLPAEADFGDVAVDARLLRAYLKEVPNGDHCHGAGIGSGAEKHLILRLAPFANSSDLRELVDSYLAQGSQVDAELIEHLAPFLDSDHLGVLIRNIAKRGKEVRVEVNVQKAPTSETKTEPNETREPHPPHAPHAPHAPAAPVVHLSESSDMADLSELSDLDDSPDALAHHGVPVEDRLRALTDRMRDPATSTEEFEELAAEVLRLKQEGR